MSAFQLPAEHIAAIVGTTWARCIERQQSDMGLREAARMAVILASENARSLRARYPHCEPEASAVAVLPTAERIAHYLAAPLSDVQLGTALKCYEYQSCEAEDWEATQAHRLCELIWRCMPGVRDMGTVDGFWPIYDPEAAEEAQHTAAAALA